ncbi:MAG: cell division ATPase MinD [Nanoarchaeota archaeon]
MTQFLGVLSGKGGVGKTTSTINIAAAINNFGKNVAAIDANLTTPNIGLHLGVPVVPVTIHDALKGKAHISEAIYMHPSGMKVIPGSISIDDLKKVEPDNIGQIFSDIKEIDLCVVDSPAGLGNNTLAVLNAVDDVLVVTNPELPSVTDSLKSIKLAEKFGKNVIGVVVTRMSDKTDMSIKNIETMLDKKVIGVIPEDKSVRHALIKKDAVVHTHPKSKAAIAYKRLAAELIGRPYKEQPKEEPFFYRLFKSLGLIK